MVSRRRRRQRASRYAPKQAQLSRSPGTACTTYKDKPAGYSPENARGLGSFGFADFEYAMCFNCALAWH
jgi:hypothetical protein